MNEIQNKQETLGDSIKKIKAQIPYSEKIRNVVLPLAITGGLYALGGYLGLQNKSEAIQLAYVAVPIFSGLASSVYLSDRSTRKAISKLDELERIAREEITSNANCETDRR